MGKNIKYNQSWLKDERGKQLHMGRTTHVHSRGSLKVTYGPPVRTVLPTCMKILKKLHQPCFFFLSPYSFVSLFAHNPKPRMPFKFIREPRKPTNFATLHRHFLIPTSESPLFRREIQPILVFDVVLFETKTYRNVLLIFFF